MSTVVRILYIAGWGRSGSTILDNMLGQVDGFFSTGELRSVWDRGLIENRLCSCGTPFRECGVWNAIFAEAFGGFEGIDAHQMLSIRDKYDYPWSVFFRRSAPSQELDAFTSALTKLYAAILKVNRAKVIVDSSKTPAYCRILQDTDGFDVDVVHLMRDPRAVAFSWQRKRLRGDKEGSYISRVGPLKSSLVWDGRQIATEAVGRRDPERYLRLRYEDFIDAPQPVIDRIVSMTGGEDARLPLEKRSIALRPVHGIAGNPSRFLRGAVALRPDDEWRTGMRRADKLVVTALTVPLLLRYRYSLTP